jgi:hypothetical protein
MAASAAPHSFSGLLAPRETDYGTVSLFVVCGAFLTVLGAILLFMDRRR